jgi:hypothetical protein
VGPLQANAPERLPQQFISLPAMKLMQKVLKVSGRRLLVLFQPKQGRNIVVVRFVHERER